MYSTLQIIAARANSHDDTIYSYSTKISQVDGGVGGSSIGETMRRAEDLNKGIEKEIKRINTVETTG